MRIQVFFPTHITSDLSKHECIYVEKAFKSRNILTQEVAMRRYSESMIQLVVLTGQFNCGKPENTTADLSAVVHVFDEYFFVF